MHLSYDIFINYNDEIALLIKSGVNLMLIGSQMHLLKERLNDTKAFIAKYSNDFAIRLIAVAYCELEAHNHALAPSYRFIATDLVLEKLGTHSHVAYDWLERSLNMLPCTTTSLATVKTPPTTNIALKQFRLNVQCLWFQTIDILYPEEGHNIFDWTYDQDVIETSVMIIRQDGDKMIYYSTRSCGR